MSEEGIPPEIIEKLKLKVEKETGFDGKIIVEQHQASIRLPKDLRNELNLPIGTITCKLRLEGNKKIIVEIR